MIGKHIEGFLFENPSELMLEASCVATVGTENTLLHALMVLSSVGYSSIPVLNSKGQLKGIISLAMIINGVKDTENYNWEQLSERQVKETMKEDPARITPDAELEDILHLLVDENYLCCTDHNGKFIGIITRKAMFKKINQFAHQFEITHEVEPRNGENNN
ncbi:MAG TPA: CBS domain-containing protein, partial [Clostridiaceae bacterium]|nr:CBS domain-containing protein [Clostridiaceae bacterium]